MATTKLSVLSQADQIVKGQIAQRRPPMVETLKAAYEQLGAMTAVAKGLREQNDGLPSAMSGGICDVIRSLSAFRSGYASNDPTQVVSGAVTKRATLPEFIGYVKTEIEKSVKEEAPEALARLRAVEAVIKAGLAEVAERPDGNKDVKKGDDIVRKADDGGVTIPVTNDPMQHVTTSVVTPGAESPAGTSSPSTASSNFAVNPGDITTPPPSTAPNPSTDSAVSTAGTGTGGQAPAPFLGSSAPVFQPGATAGAASSTSGALAVATGATNSGTDVSSFSPDQIAKRAADTEAEIAKGLEDARKAAELSTKRDRPRDGWAMDLNSKEFMSGKRGIDFGSDGSARTP